MFTFGRQDLETNASINSKSIRPIAKVQSRRHSMERVQSRSYEIFIPKVIPHRYLTELRRALWRTEHGFASCLQAGKYFLSAAINSTKPVRLNCEMSQGKFFIGHHRSP